MFFLSASPGPSRSPTPKPNPGPLLHVWDSAPAWLVALVVTAVALGAIVTAVQPLWNIAAFLFKLAFRPVKNRRQSSEEAYRAQQRRGFARYVVSQLERLAVAEDWRDDRFAELEAEVEVQGRERIVPWLRFSPYRNVTLRREKSLSTGLARTTDSLVILEGEPGSGKSVALRHLADHLARKAQNSDSSTSLIPLYVNLKEFRPTQRPVDANAVHDFIVDSLTRAHDRNADQFIRDEFDRGMMEGSWLLLLDSFDEIPDVLSSTESDNTVAEYALAMRDFLTGMRKGRAVVASREFRGPQAFNVPRFRIVNLTAEQQGDLVRKSGLRPMAQAAVHAGLADADPELRQLARNPMFLGLVCEYVRSRDTFPPSSHAAYDSFLEQRLTRDADRLRKRYGVGPDEVRLVAEETAFCMTATKGLGLSPARADLRVALAADGRISLRLLDKVLDALEYTKLGRAADDPAGAGVPHFTFAHRRFQEYFATRVVLRAPDRVPVQELLANGRWRETAVTILQTQPAEATGPLLAEVELLIGPMATSAEAGQPASQDAAGFAWPPGSLALLQLLDAGLGRVPESLGQAIRDACARLLRAAWASGRRHDRKWAVSMGLVAARDTSVWLVEQAFESGSVYLGGAGYTVVSRMTDPPESVYAGVRRTLLDNAASGQLKAEQVTLKAQITRLPDPEPLLRTLHLLRYAQTVSILLAAAIVAGDALLYPWLLIVDAIALPMAIRAFPAWYTRDAYGANAIATETSADLVIFFTHFAVLTNHRYWADSLLALVIIYFIAVWPIGVITACDEGFVPSTFGWPGMFFIGMVREMNLRTLISLRFWGRGAFFCLGTAAAVTLIGLGVWLWQHNPVGRTVISGVCLAALAVFFVMVVSQSLIASRRMVREIVALRRDKTLVRELTARAVPLDAPDLLTALGTVSTARNSRRVLELACRTDLTASRTMLRVVSDLSAVIEARTPDAFVTPADGKSTVKVGPEVDVWLRGCDERALKALQKTGDTAIDMLTRAIEQAELARQELATL